MIEDKYIDKSSFGTVIPKDKSSMDMEIGSEAGSNLSDEDFKKLAKGQDTDLEGDERENKERLVTAYKNIIDILKKYLDIREESYNIIALWIIGTYFHDRFPSYPYLFFNAMKGSGKSRTINLITCLSKDGSVQNSMTEAVLFRTKGTLAIDEFEGVGKKGQENLRELLNSAYKKGVMVKRMRQKKTDEGVEQVVEEFEVYRPIVLANIWGMDNVLGDRCVEMILEKSVRKDVINLMEIFSEELIVKSTKELLDRCSKCRSLFSGKLYQNWNLYVQYGNNKSNNYTNYTKNTNYTNYTKPFEIINKMGLNGREIELSFPICLIANEISEELLKVTTLTFQKIFNAKKEDELVDNPDISLYDFVSQYPHKDFQFLSDILKEFREFTQINDEWLHAKWMTRALKRLNLLKKKRRVGRGTSVILDIAKAQEKIKIFK